MRVSIFKRMGLLGVYSRISRNLNNPMVLWVFLVKNLQGVETVWEQQNDQKWMCWKPASPLFEVSRQISRTWFSAFLDWRWSLKRGWGISVRSTPRKSKRRSIRRPGNRDLGRRTTLSWLPMVGGGKPASETTKPLKNWSKTANYSLCAS